jgi:hypothetical protein
MRKPGWGEGIGFLPFNDSFLEFNLGASVLRERTGLEEAYGKDGRIRTALVVCADSPWNGHVGGACEGWGMEGGPPHPCSPQISAAAAPASLTCVWGGWGGR